MNDWQIVTEAEPWVIDEADAAAVGLPDKPFQNTGQFMEAFPRLAALLSHARQTAVLLPAGPHLLFAWGEPSSGIRAWLCPLAPKVVPTGAAPEHQILLECFGGIVERFNEPEDNWLLNHNHALTAAEVAQDASFMVGYTKFKECGGIPIKPSDWYPAAWEANGNCVLCARAARVNCCSLHQTMRTTISCRSAAARCIRSTLIRAPVHSASGLKPSRCNGCQTAPSRRGDERPTRLSCREWPPVDRPA